MIPKIAVASAIALAGMASSLTAQSIIEVSCYRGPLKAVIWDRANPGFVESLVAYGFSNATANTMADGICRNPVFVDDPKKLAPAVQAIVAATPKDG